MVILLLVRLLGPAKRRERDQRDDPPAGSGAAPTDRVAGADKDQRARSKGAERDASEREPQRELMLRCALCSVHLPSSEAVFSGGKVYCSAAHRDAARPE